MDTPIECIKWRPDRSKRTRQDEFRERVNSKFRLTLGESGHTHTDSHSDSHSVTCLVFAAANVGGKLVGPAYRYLFWGTQTVKEIL